MKKLLKDYTFRSFLIIVEQQGSYFIIASSAVNSSSEFSFT